MTFRVTAEHLSEALTLADGCLYLSHGEVLVGTVSSPPLDGDGVPMVDRADIVRHLIENGNDRVAAANAISDLHATWGN